MYYLGIDIGGTFIKYALIHKNMKVIKKWKKETQKYETVEAFYDYLCADIYNLNEIELIGVSAPGVIDETSQVMSEAAKNVRIMYKTYVNQEIEKRLHKPTATINDAKAAGLCELKLGQGQNTKTSAYVLIGTGIGGCFCDENGAIQGHDYLAGDLSCLPFAMIDGQIVSASRYASMSALITIYNQIANEPLQYGTEICERYLNNEENALKAMNQWCTNIIFVLNTITLCYNPEVICIGGGISEEQWFIQKIQKMYQELIPKRFASLVTTKIKSCQYHNDANLLGAVLYTISNRE